jgi:large conductance mechanosensitive channel
LQNKNKYNKIFLGDEIMFKEFKEFISKGNVMDMAVGVIIGGAFASIVNALTESFIQPLLNLIGGAEVKGTIPLGNTGQALNYGAFITAVINFLIIALILFLMVKAVNTAEKKAQERLEKLAKKKGKTVEEVAVEEAPKSSEVLLLEEIRDLLKKGKTK